MPKPKPTAGLAASWVVVLVFLSVLIWVFVDEFNSAAIAGTSEASVGGGDGGTGCAAAGCPYGGAECLESAHKNANTEDTGMNHESMEGFANSANSTGSTVGGTVGGVTARAQSRNVARQLQSMSSDRKNGGEAVEEITERVNRILGPRVQQVDSNYVYAPREVPERVQAATPPKPQYNWTDAAARDEIQTLLPVYNSVQVPSIGTASRLQVSGNAGYGERNAGAIIGVDGNMHPDQRALDALGGITKSDFMELRGQQSGAPFVPLDTNASFAPSQSEQILPYGSLEQARRGDGAPADTLAVPSLGDAAAIRLANSVDRARLAADDPNSPALLRPYDPQQSMEFQGATGGASTNLTNTRTIFQPAGTATTAPGGTADGNLYAPLDSAAGKYLTDINMIMNATVDPSVGREFNAKLAESGLY
ncbi:MAG: hypothetical protein CMK92_04865 [Pseudomonas sp.]|nr:hypothetical protein [Pseudomonas sp.]